jgi:lysyl-tRNA synthetase, class II
MASLNELRQVRLKKISLLKEAGMDPYPLNVSKSFSIKAAKEKFADLEKNQNRESISGRVMAIRGQGAIFFVVLDDGTEKLQAVFKKDVLTALTEGTTGPDSGISFFDLFCSTVDIGDFISVTGSFFKTQRGEESVLVDDWAMASKSLLPLPEKWHGLTDEEEKLRKRYLDFVMNPDLKDLFYKKAKFWETIRSFMKERDFLEVETPTLEVTTGGAEARPFKTHHNDLDLDIYLRISVGELWQKRLMAGGFPQTFEIGRVYRNEGSSPEHLQEFTNMEFYSAFLDFEEGKKIVRDLYIKIAKDVFGKTEFETRGHKFNLESEWQELDYVSTIKKMTGVNVLEASYEELKKRLEELDIKYEGETIERMTDTLWKYCRKKISGPAYLVNHPKIVAPLSKENPSDSRLTKTFQIIIAGSEIGRAHSELNDPLDQENRFKVQQELIKKGDEEAMMSDHEFVEMLEHGMPPCFGFGMGERLFAFLADKTAREITLFPLLKPR